MGEGRKANGRKAKIYYYGLQHRVLHGDGTLVAIGI